MDADSVAEHTPSDRQPMRSQMADAGFLLALLFVTLFVSTFVLAGDGGSDAGDARVTPIAELPISSAEKRQFQVMVDQGLTDEATVSQSVADNAPRDDKYEFSWLALIGTVALAGAYLAFVYRTSSIEYREVVRARFDPDREDTT